MKKEKKTINNFVHKHANEFNRASTYRDRKNDYKRSRKHRSKDYDRFVFLMSA